MATRTVSLLGAWGRSIHARSLTRRLGGHVSALGALARHLAQRLAEPYATGAAVASLSKELRRTMDLVVQGVKPADDPSTC
jgi:hypothetical protein